MGILPVDPARLRLQSEGSPIDYRFLPFFGVGFFAAGFAGFA
jgi:hypothetical protein